MELAYRLAVDDSPYIKFIRSHMIVLITPVVKWMAATAWWISISGTRRIPVRIGRGLSIGAIMWRTTTIAMRWA